MKLPFFILFLFVCALVQSQNITTVYSEKSYQLDEHPPGTPMFTYPLLILDNGNVLSVTSYKKQYLKYVFLNNQGKEIYSGKIDFVKFPKYSAYIYKFQVQGTKIIGYAIVQEEIEKKNHDVMYRYEIDMATNQLISEEIVANRSLAGNKYGTLTVISDEKNEAVTLLKCMRPEKNTYTFDIAVFNNKNEKIVEKQLEYKNADFKEVFLSINAFRYLSDKLVFCSMTATNKDYTKTIPLYFMVGISKKEVVINQIDLGEVYSARCILTHHLNHNKMALNYLVVSDVKTNILTSESKRYYNFYTIHLDIETKKLSEPVALPIQNLTAWLAKNTKNNDVEKRSLFPLNYIMEPNGNQAVILGNGFDGVGGGDAMSPGSYYYSHSTVAYNRPSVIGSLVTNPKGLEEGNTYYGSDFPSESNYMFDLLASKNGHYILYEKAIEKNNSGPADKSVVSNHFFSAVHINDNGKTTLIDLVQNPSNITENIYFLSKSSPILNPPPTDGYNSYYKTNYNRNVICYRLKKQNEATFKYVWLQFE